MREDGEAFKEWIKPLNGPGAKETKETHAGLTALWTPRAPTDLARNDEWTHAALGEIVGLSRQLHRLHL